MNKFQAVELLRSEGWTQADAERALAGFDFRTNPDELQIRRVISSFSGSELIQRQRLQAAQKALVTKKATEIDRINAEICRLKADNDALQAELTSEFAVTQTDRGDLQVTHQALEQQLQLALLQNKQLVSANEQLQKDNKQLKNLIDAIKLKLTRDTKQLLQYKDSEIRRAVVKLFQSTLG